MNDIKHNQADNYEEQGVTRKNAPGLSIVPKFQPETNATSAGVQFVLPIVPVHRSVGTANIRNCALLAISLAALSGCSAWSSNPARTQADYGASVRNMVSNQIYNPDKAQNPDATLPDGMDGDKTNSVLNKTYRGLVFTPREDLRHTTTYGQPNISILGGGGAR